MKLVPTLATFLAAAALLAACGQSTTPQAPTSAPNPNAPEPNAAGDIPDNQVYVPFSPADHTFTVKVPEGWARTTDGTATVFSDKFNSVRVEAAPRPQAPTVQTATAEEVPTLRALPGYKPGAVDPVKRTAGNGVLITYQATSPADPVTGKTVTESVERYEFWHGGREIIITLTGPKGADNVDPWRTVTNSLRWP
ncbi:hypothetical protein [Actinophytocola sp.]|jgi:hypothetical protein|uniref:hypothetical protein n=1 Tax=Actinophytocola sp. TaxID=1872138 RepID=UPI002ED8F49C